MHTICSSTVALTRFFWTLMNSCMPFVNSASQRLATAPGFIELSTSKSPGKRHQFLHSFGQRADLATHLSWRMLFSKTEELPGHLAVHEIDNALGITPH
jgi:hypothetical protein